MKKDNNYTDSEELKEDELGKKPIDKDVEKLQDNNVDENVSDEENSLEELREKYDDLNNNYLRLHAEFDNFRKRTIKEKADIIKSGGERVLSEMLPLADDFERAMQALHLAEDKEAVVEGMDLIYAKFVQFLNGHGVKEIDSVGQPFDADKFEALTTIPVEDESKKGKIVDCIQKGYALNDKIIRFPKVIVGE